jgi:hypothetical protein
MTDLLTTQVEEFKVAFRTLPPELILTPEEFSRLARRLNTEPTHFLGVPLRIKPINDS